MKPCRRCGLDVTPDGIEVTQTDTGAYIARFECPDCGEVAETYMCHSSEDFAVANMIDEWNGRWVDPALLARIEELEKEKSELLAKCEKYECEIGLSKQRIAALESKSNMYIDLSVAMASTARKVDGLEKERDRLREALEETRHVPCRKEGGMYDSDGDWYVNECSSCRKMHDIAREALKGVEE